MQVTELKKEKLVREYQVTVPATTINKKIEEQLQSVGKRVKIPGFRPGHVPTKILKQRYGKSIMGEVLESAVKNASNDVLKEKAERPAMQPHIEITDYNEGKDLQFKMAYEVLPELPAVDAKKMKLEKLVYDVPKKDIDEGIERIASQHKSYAPRAKSEAAKNGDAVKIDFEGFIDGEAFAGGAAKGHTLELGSGQFIPGFEEQLVGGKAGDNVTVKVAFPKEYHSADLAGKKAEFKVAVHEVLEPKPAKIDDDFAKNLGLESLAKLKEAVEKQLRKDYDQIARTRLKKQLFDYMDEQYAFEAPAGMVKMEFDSIWERLQEAKKQGDESLNRPEKELRDEYGAIAERRVRLGLLLAEIGRRHNLKVNQDELSRAVMDQARMFPGQEAKIFEFYQQNPQHLEELKGPILEEKAVDYIIEQAQVSEKKVSIEELLAEEEEEVGGSSSKKSAAKKPAAKGKTTDKASTDKKTTAKSAKSTTSKGKKKSA